MMCTSVLCFENVCVLHMVVCFDFVFGRRTGRSTHNISVLILPSM